MVVMRAGVWCLVFILATGVRSLVAEGEPAVSVVYALSEKEFGKYEAIYSRVGDPFGQTPIEIVRGKKEDEANAAARIVILVKRPNLVWEQNADAFILQRSQHGIILSRQPFIGGWKNVAIAMDYQIVLRTGEKKNPKFKLSALGFAAGKTGPGNDLQLNNNGAALMQIAAADVGWRWQRDLLSQLGPPPVFANKMWPEILEEFAQLDQRSASSNNVTVRTPAYMPLLIAPARVGYGEGSVIAQFQLKNALPVQVDFEAQFCYIWHSRYVASVRAADTGPMKVSLKPGESMTLSASDKTSAADADEFQTIVLRIKQPPKYTLLEGEN